MTYPALALPMSVELPPLPMVMAVTALAFIGLVTRWQKLRSPPLLLPHVLLAWEQDTVTAFEAAGILVALHTRVENRHLLLVQLSTGCWRIVRNICVSIDTSKCVPMEYFAVPDETEGRQIFELYKSWLNAS